MKEFIEKLNGRLKGKIDILKHNREVFDKEQMLTQYAMCEAEIVAFEEVVEIVKHLAEEYNNGWIPCSDRLPEESELVLVYAESTARGGSIRVVGHLHNGFWFTQTSSDTLGLTGIGQFKVIAWQPLPEPFKQKGAGE